MTFLTELAVLEEHPEHEEERECRDDPKLQGSFDKLGKRHVDPPDLERVKNPDLNRRDADEARTVGRYTTITSIHG